MIRTGARACDGSIVVGAGVWALGRGVMIWAWARTPGRAMVLVVGAGDLWALVVRAWAWRTRAVVVGTWARANRSVAMRNSAGYDWLCRLGSFLRLRKCAFQGMLKIFSHKRLCHFQWRGDGRINIGGCGYFRRGGYSSY